MLDLTFSGDGDTTEQHEPLLSESQDESLTLLGQPDATIPADDKLSSVINVNEDLDEAATPLLGDPSDRKEVKNKLFFITPLPFPYVLSVDVIYCFN